MKRKILAVAIVFVMLFTAFPIAMTASAEPPPCEHDICTYCGECRLCGICNDIGSITIQKANNLTLQGQKFEIYKIFDMKMDIIAGTYDYTITNDFEAFKKVDTGFDALITQFYPTPAATDPKTLKEFLYDVNNADGADLKSNQEIALTKALQKFITDNAIAPMMYDVEAASPYSQIVISNIPLGYYFIMGGGYNPTQGSLGTGIEREVTALSMLTTTHPSTTVNLKADAPDIDKKVQHSNLAENKQHCEDLIKCNEGNGSEDDLCPACANAPWQDWTDANITETVNFKITSKVPDMRGYTNYTYTVYDKLSKGLTYAQSTLVVKVDGDTLSSVRDYNVTYSTDGTTYGTFPAGAYPTTGLYIKIDFVNFAGYKNKEGAPVVITYSATLNENAVINQDTSSNGNPNDVWLEYSNNPYVNNSKGRTPIRRVRVFTFELPIIKKDEQGNPLAGAIFQLYKESGGAFSWNSTSNTATNGTLISLKYLDPENYVFSDMLGIDLPEGENGNYPLPAITKVYNSFITSTSGAVNIKGLEAGTYYLVETSAPNKYNKLKDAVKITIGYTTNDGDAVGGNTDDHVSNLVDFTSLRTLKKANGTETLLLGIENRKGVLFPETGSTGTAIFIIIGSLLTLGAGTFLTIRSRTASVRRRREENSMIAG